MHSIADAVASAGSLAQLNTVFDRAVSRFGFDFFAGGCLRDGTRPADLFLLRWPRAWTDPGSAAAEDPIVAAIFDSPASFTWDEVAARQPGAPARAFGIAEMFGWRAGLVVPVHGPNGERGVVSLAARCTSMNADDRRWIERTCVLAYRRGRALKAAGGRAGLSGREGDALSLVACGRDDLEISEALRVSKATAHAHVERAKRRLGARSRAHAVAIAMSHGLL